MVQYNNWRLLQVSSELVQHLECIYELETGGSKLIGKVVHDRKIAQKVVRPLPTFYSSAHIRPVPYMENGLVY